VDHEARSPGEPTEREVAMLWTIAIILLILWLLGMVSFHALGAYVHILLVLAIIAVLIRIVQGRNPL
jgi:fatty acid desaturase